MKGRWHEGEGRGRVTHLCQEAKHADADEERAPLCALGEDKGGTGVPHQKGADDGRVEGEVGDGMRRRGAMADGADRDVGPRGPAYPQEGEAADVEE